MQSILYGSDPSIPQTVTMSISAINQMNSTIDETCRFHVATMKNIPFSMVEGGHYAFTTNESGSLGKKIMGSLDKEMPASTFFYVELEAPPGGLSAGKVLISLFPIDLVTGIPIPTHQSGLEMTYTFTVTSTIPPSNYPRILTLTLMDQ